MTEPVITRTEIDLVTERLRICVCGACKCLVRIEDWEEHLDRQHAVAAP